MGVFSNMAEKAHQSTKDRNSQIIEEFLFEGENIENIYPLKNDFAALTNKRLIFVDQNVLVKETGVVSVPYSRIDKIAIVKDKTWAITDEVEITTRHDKFELKFLRDSLDFYNRLAQHIC
jgi:hypothetical protein